LEFFFFPGQSRDNFCTLILRPPSEVAAYSYSRRYPLREVTLGQSPNFSISISDTLTRSVSFKVKWSTYLYRFSFSIPQLSGLGRPPLRGNFLFLSEMRLSSLPR